MLSGGTGVRGAGKFCLPGSDASQFQYPASGTMYETEPRLIYCSRVACLNCRFVPLFLPELLSPFWSLPSQELLEHTPAIHRLNTHPSCISSSNVRGLREKVCRPERREGVRRP